MKMTWEIPQIMVQEFEANEYVAACWTVACRVGSGNYGGYTASCWGNTEPYGDNCHDHTGSCSSAINNQFKVGANRKVSFYAENNDQQGTLNGGYTSYIDNNGNGIVDNDDIIFWYTLSGSGDRRWNHYGTVTAADPSHPNRS